MIIVDSYEPDKVKKAFNNTQPISVDYFVVGSKEKWAIERKTFPDLISSVRDGRLWKQLERLKQLRDNDGYKVALLLEGHKYLLFKIKKFKVSNAQVQGIIIAVAKFGIPTITTENMDLTIMTLRQLEESAGDNVEWTRPTIHKSGRTKKEEVEDLVSAIDGIGVKSAKNLLNRFKSVKNIVNAETADLATVVSIREAKHMEDVFEREY